MNRMRMFLAVAILASTTTLEAQSCPSTCAGVAQATVDSALKNMKTPRLNSLEASRAKMQAALDSLAKKVSEAKNSTDVTTRADILALRGRAEYYSAEVEKLKVEIAEIKAMDEQQNKVLDAQGNLILGPQDRPAGVTREQPKIEHSKYALKESWYKRPAPWFGIGLGLVGGYLIGANNGLWGTRPGGKDVTVITNVCVSTSCR